MIKYVVIASLLLSMCGGAEKSERKPDLFEDTFALYALDAQIRHKFHFAAGFFAELHKQTGKKAYLYDSLKMYEYANDAKALEKATKEALNKFQDDEILKRFEVIALLKGGKLESAAQKARLLSETDPKLPDHLLYAETQLKSADYAGAVETLKKAYALSFDNTTAERIGLVMYAHLGDKKEAIKFLQDHIGTHGNSVVIGKRLGSFYSDAGGLEEAATIYERTYEEFSDASCAEEALKIYHYKQDFPRMVGLLEKSRLNDPLLLNLYVQGKLYDKASELALKLYEAEENLHYLAQSAVYKYEGASNRKDPALVAEVTETLKKAAEEINDPLFLNYLGYLMIDHDTDVAEGMGYVRRALEIQPDSAYYIDSLAWGHYKQGECSEALRLIKQVESMIGSEEQEVKEHIDAIEKCKSKEKNQ